MGTFRIIRKKDGQIIDIREFDVTFTKKGKFDFVTQQLLEQALQWALVGDDVSIKFVCVNEKYYGKEE